MEICKDGKRQLALNFNESEFYSGSFDAPDCHYFNDTLITGAQLIRNVINSSIIVDSTFRTQAHNLALLSNESSRHRTGNAEDLSFSQTNALSFVQDDLLNNGNLFKVLRSIGINGFGIYDTFIHLDIRPEVNLKHSDNYGDFAFWNNSKKKAKV